MIKSISVACHAPQSPFNELPESPMLKTDKQLHSNFPRKNVFICKEREKDDLLKI